MEALTRFLEELAIRDGKAGKELEERSTEIVSEFSLDRDDSARTDQGIPVLAKHRFSAIVDLAVAQLRVS